jgi:hypothetical protein
MTNSVYSAKMAATTNGNGNLVDEFEEAFQVLLTHFVLVKECLLNVSK